MRGHCVRESDIAEQVDRERRWAVDALLRQGANNGTHASRQGRSSDHVR